jgi:hypothetical protein
MSKNQITLTERQYIVSKFEALINKASKESNVDRVHNLS